MIELLQYEFMKNALIASLLISVACGIVGTYIAVKRMTFISGGIAHTAFGGIGLGYFLNINPLLAALPFTILSALGIGVLNKKMKVNQDSAIGMVWALGMALGIMFIYLTPGYAPDLFSYLFGSILTVSGVDLGIILLIDVFIVGVVALFFEKLKAICFDEEFAKIRGVNTDFLYFILLTMIAMSIIALIKVVGVILVIALLTIPSALSRKFTNNLGKMIIYSILFSLFFTVSGLLLSYEFNVPSGATIILFSGFVFLVLNFIYKN